MEGSKNEIYRKFQFKELLNGQIPSLLINERESIRIKKMTDTGWRML